MTHYTQPYMQLSLALVASFAALGGFLFGYDLGLIGGALIVINEQFGTSSFEEACIVGAAKVGAVIGVFLGGAYMYRHGRKAAILVDSIFFTVGPLVMASAVSVATLVLGRLIVGMGIGFSAVVVPAYLGEVAPQHVRGSVVTLYELMLCVGMVVSSLADASLQGMPGSWRWMVGLPIVPGLALVFAPLVLPESPRWLVMAGDLPSALAALHHIRCSQVQQDSSRSTADVEDELLTLWNAVEQDQASWNLRNASSHQPQAATVVGGRAAAQQQRNSPLCTASTAEQNTSPTQEVRHSGGHVQQVMHARIECSGMPEKGSSPDASPRKRRQGNNMRGSSGEEHLNLLSPTAAATNSTSEDTGAFRVACMDGMEASPQHIHGRHSNPTDAGNAHDRLKPHGNDHAGLSVHAFDSVSSAPAANVCSPEPSHMHGMWSDACSCDADAIMPASGLQKPGTITSAMSWLQGVWVQRSMHEYLATTVPASEVIAMHMRARYDMHTPMHLVLWRMLRDCKELLMDAFSLRCSREQGCMHEQHALCEQPACSSSVNTDMHGGIGEFAALSPQLNRAESPTQPPHGMQGQGVAHTAQRRAIRIAVVLAFFNQISASTSIINYAPVVLERVGAESGERAMEMAAVVSFCKTLGILLGILTIDRLSRRTLLVAGSGGCALSLFSLAIAVWEISPLLALVAMSAYMLVFSACWAGVFWVVCAEIFAMSIKSPGMALATASLFLAGAVADILFPLLLSWLQGAAFVVYGLLAVLGGVYVFVAVPETKGLSLLEVQAALQF